MAIIGYLTPTQTLRIRELHQRAKKAEMPHRANDAFYALLDRRQPAAVHHVDRDAGTVTATWPMRPDALGHHIAPQTLTLSATSEILRRVAAEPPDVAAYQDRDHGDLEILADQALWPGWPRLWVDRIGYWDPGDRPVDGYIVSGDVPRDAGMGWRIKRLHADAWLYADAPALLADGWRPRHR